MSTERDSRISWKTEVAALACGLLLGTAWEAARADVPASGTVIARAAQTPHP